MKIKHAIQARFSQACASLRSFFRYSKLQCSNSVRLLVRLQPSILQPSALYGCEVGGPPRAATGPLWEIQSLQHLFLCQACCVKSSVPVRVISEELSVDWWHEFWWQEVLNFWNEMMVRADSTISNIVLHDANALAQNGSSFTWDTQVIRCFAEHGKVQSISGQSSC